MAYRTVSTDAVLVIVGLIPINLLVQERRNIFFEEEGNRETRKKLERAETFRKWQEEFDASPNGRWTSRLIQNVEAWTRRRHGNLTYYVTQFLSGHGSFGDYLKRIKRRERDTCKAYNFKKVNFPELYHAFLHTTN
ncbi:uncharacterized protein LOC108915767 [Anoplophora glabripennis]|uniref:uncharacterized protein LOC108915767 n=1 Tax=Anoplophora glabripennis TaxID=217634 RepID=UPI000873E7CA|nr:uncharacterized protein LOC108915767 [Anoplophora glabripennis]